MSLVHICFLINFWRHIKHFCVVYIFFTNRTEQLLFSFFTFYFGYVFLRYVFENSGLLMMWSQVTWSSCASPGLLVELEESVAT